MQREAVTEKVIAGAWRNLGRVVSWVNLALIRYGEARLGPEL